MWAVNRKYFNNFYLQSHSFSERNLFSGERDKYMRPLLTKDIDSFLKRFGNFVDGEIREVKLISPTVIEMTIAGQDEARSFDWITVNFEFSGVSDATLTDESQTIHVDMNNGISIENLNNKFVLSVKNATFKIVSQTIKYQEGQF